LGNYCDSFTVSGIQMSGSPYSNRVLRIESEEIGSEVTDISLCELDQGIYVFFGLFGFEQYSLNYLYGEGQNTTN
jgi:hypothetical protein